jgi:hypothetical protein
MRVEDERDDVDESPPMRGLFSYARGKRVCAQNAKDPRDAADTSREV